MKWHNRKQGFTLIELIIVLVLIGVLSAVAIPRFEHLHIYARVNSIRGVAGNVRSALTICKAENLVHDRNNGSNHWPTVGQLLNTTQAATVQSSPLDSVMPDNAFNSDNLIYAVSILQAHSRTIVAPQTGWAYCESDGIFYANSNTTPAKMPPQNENLF